MGQLSPKPYKAHSWYRRAFWVAAVLLVLALVSILLSQISAHPWTARLTARLYNWLPPQAMSNTISAVGLAGTAFTWLVTNAERRVCGSRVAELVDWVYPRFFRLYFLLLVPHALVGLLAGRAGWFWPTLYSFAGMLLCIALLGRACYVFVVRADKRERYAFAYYTACLEAANDRKRIALNGPEGGSIPEEAGRLRGAEQEIKGILLNAADYTRALIWEEHRDVAGQTAKLWAAAFTPREEQGWQALLARYNRNEEDSVLQNTELSKEVWAALLPTDCPQECWADGLAPMLGYVDAQAEKCHSAYFPILLGLVQFLEVKSYGDPCRLVQEMTLLLRGRYDTLLAQHLACAGLMTLAVAWLDGATEGVAGALALAGKSLWEALSQPLKPRPRELREPEVLDGLLLYAEWSARRARGMSLNRYLIQVHRLFVDDTRRRNTYFDMKEHAYRCAMLICFLQQEDPEYAPPDRETQI